MAGKRARFVLLLIFVYFRSSLSQNEGELLEQLDIQENTDVTNTPNSEDSERTVSEAQIGIIDSVPIDSSINFTRNDVINEINSDLTGIKTIAVKAPIIDGELRREIVAELKKDGVTSASGDRDAFFVKVNDYILKQNNVDEPDAEYTSIFKDNSVALDTSKTLSFTEIERKSLSSLTGTTVDFSPVTSSTQFSLRGKRLDMKAVSFNKETVVALTPYLSDRSVADFMVVATGVAKIKRLVAEKNGLKVSSIMPLEEIALYENDISLEADDIETILNETAEEPDLLVLNPSRDIKISPVTGIVVPAISATLPTIQVRETASDTEFRETVQAELTDLLDHLRRRREARHTRVKRKATTRSSAKWWMPIKYRIKSGPTSTIEAAVDHWEQHTCLRFKKVGWTIGNHLKFQNSASGCWSKLGRKPFYIFGQPVNIGSGCNSMGIVVHEIGHAIGFWHEQARPDRDLYIIVNSGNIQNGRHSQFVKKSWKNIFAHGVSYDYASIMHYGPNAFSKNGNPTIEVKEDGYERTIGQRRGLSFSDAKMANYHYNCHSKCGTSSLTWSACHNGGYRDPNNCGQCKCPDGWSGKYCNIPMTGSTTDCGNKYQYATTAWKSIQSPGYTSPGYPVNAKCSWKIYTSYGRRVTLRFNSAHSFGIQCRTTCNDYVEVMYKHMSRIGERYCCSRPTKYFRSHGTSMLVNFRSNSGSGYQGFKAEYKSEKCGGCAPGSTEAIQPVCYEAVKYSCPGKYYVGCGFWNLNRCARYRSNTCYKTQTKCCESNYYYKYGSICRRKYGSWGSWSSWRSCSATCGMCGVRTRQRTRSCLYPSCSPSSLKEIKSQKCASTACPLKYQIVSYTRTTKCGFWGWRRCTKVAYRSEKKPRCCNGYRLSGSICIASG